MRHEPPAAFTPVVDTEHDVARARAYIDTVRACGYIIVPWRGMDGAPGVATFDGPDDGDGGASQPEKEPDWKAAKRCRKGLVFKLLCADYGVSPDDPYLRDRINEQLRAAEAARVAA